MEAIIFLIRQFMERCMKQKKDLYMVFINLENAYDKVPTNVMWWTLQKHKVLISTLPSLRICTMIL
jgi:hypothetical protein